MYRKFSANHIFTGYEILTAPSVLITDTTGFIIDIVEYKNAGDGIEWFNGLLCPGFINAHCHLELSHLKGIIPEKTGLVDFVAQILNSRGLYDELKSDAMRQAQEEMYKTGIIAVGDICNTVDSIPIKQHSELLWHNFIEVSGFVDGAAQKRLEEAKKVYNQFQTSTNHERVTLSPHAPYSVSEKLFQLLNKETVDQLITIHNQEAATEDELFLHSEGGFLTLYKNFGIDISGFKASGKSSFQTWIPLFTNNQTIITVHNTFFSEDDLIFAGNHPQNLSDRLFYCLCINANKYIENKIPPIDLLIKGNCNIILGTDSLASNRQLNIFEEIKTIQEDTYHTIPLQELLKWATINGATALQLNHIIGSFEKGKKAGIVLIEGLNNFKTTPDSSARRII